MAADTGNSSSYDGLQALFADWREFERPPTLDGAPDYTAATFESRILAFAEYRERLNAIDPAAWPVAQKVDWHIVRAEMNGFDFNHRVLKPWARDPAYYQSIFIARSDVPAVTHVDYSARVQSVHAADNPDYHELIAKFEQKTGCAMLVNTSFNVRGEPIVETPEDALHCFLGTDMDLLVVHDRIVAKRRLFSRFHKLVGEMSRLREHKSVGDLLREAARRFGG